MLWVKAKKVMVRLKLLSVKQTTLQGFVTRPAQMLVGKVRHFTSARGTLKESLLDKERLVHILDGAGILAQCGCYGADAHRTALELVNDGGQYTVVNLIQAVFVYVKCLKGDIGY